MPTRMPIIPRGFLIASSCVIARLLSTAEPRRRCRGQTSIARGTSFGYPHQTRYKCAVGHTGRKNHMWTRSSLLHGAGGRNPAGDGPHGLSGSDRGPDPRARQYRHGHLRQSCGARRGHRDAAGVCRDPADGGIHNVDKRIVSVEEIFECTGRRDEGDRAEISAVSRPGFTTSRLTWCSGICVLPVMDDEAELFMFEIEHKSLGRDHGAVARESIRPRRAEAVAPDCLCRHPRLYLEPRQLSWANRAAGRDRPAHRLDRGPMSPRLDPCPFFRQGDQGRTEPASGGVFNRVTPEFWGKPRSIS